MNVCLKLLRFLSIYKSGEEDHSWNFLEVHQLFSKRTTMSSNEENKKTDDLEATEDKGSIRFIDQDSVDELEISVEELASDTVLRSNGLITTNNKDRGDVVWASTNSQHLFEPSEASKKRSAKIETSITDFDNLKYKSTSWSTDANFGDIVCFGATLMIVMLLISILIFYVFKDNERDVDT